MGGAIKERLAPTAVTAWDVCRPLPFGAHNVPTPHAVTGWAVVSVVRYRHGPAPVRSQLGVSTHVYPGRMDDYSDVHAATPDPAADRIRDGWMPHKGRHHYAKCGTYRPVMGNYDCPNCPQVCPGCGSAYNRPGPVDPRG